MKKEDYFKIVHDITRAMRQKGFEYVRIFSEPRVMTGYRTKIWHVCGGTHTAIKLAKEIEKYCSRVNAKAHYGDSSWGRHTICVTITPHDFHII